MSSTPDSPKRDGRGRPGKFPGSPKTVRIRVPEGMEEYVYWALTELPDIYDDYVRASKDSRNWTEFRRFSRAVRTSQLRHLNALLTNGEISSVLAYNPNWSSLTFACDPPQDVD